MKLIEIEELCKLEPKTAAAQIRKPFLNDLSKNIREIGNGILGSGHGYALIHAIS